MSFENIFKNLIPPKVPNFEQTDDRLQFLSLSDKRAADKSQIIERNDFASFLVDSSAFYKTNRFFCVVFPPSTLGGALREYYNKSQNGFRFTCEAANLPSQTLETFDFKLDNNTPVVKVPFNMNYGDTITLTFRMSKNFLERKFFLTWQENVFTFNGGNPGARYMNEYSGNSSIVLSQIDTANNKIYNTEFTNAYPIEVSGIDYNWMPGDDYVRQNVTFAFTRMFSEGVKRGEDYPRGIRTDR